MNAYNIYSFSDLLIDLLIHISIYLFIHLLNYLCVYLLLFHAKKYEHCTQATQHQTSLSSPCMMNHHIMIHMFLVTYCTSFFQLIL